MATLSWHERISLLKAAAFPKQQAQQAAMILSRIQGNQPSGDPPSRGASGMLESYSTMPWVRAVAGRVAGSMAAVEWRLYKALPTKGSQRAIKAPDLQFSSYAERKSLIQQRREAGELLAVPEHLLLTALTKGNGYHTGVALRRLTQLSLDLVGETFWLKARNALKAPVAFWPIPATWVQDTPTPAKPTFGISHRGWNEEIPQSEIAWLCDPNPADPYGRGVGYMHSLSDEAEIDEYAAKTARQLFFNRATPDFLVYPKGPEGQTAEMSPTEVRRFETDWLNRLQGYWKSYKPYFLSREVGVYEFSKDMQALQLLPIRNQERDIIIQVFGVPPERFGILNNSNRSTIDASDLIYAKDVMVPRLEFWRSYLQERMVPEYDDRLILDYVTPVMEDRDFMLKAAQFAPWAMDGNEWRSIMGLAPKDEFDGVYFVPPAVTPVNAAQLGVDLSEPDIGLVEEVPPPTPPKKSLSETMADAITRLVSPVIHNTVNVPERSVTIERSEVHVAPAAVQVDVQPQAITVEGAKFDVQVPEQAAPVVNVKAPIVHVAAPTVNVAAPNVDVHVPAQKPRKELRTVHRDANHLITKINIEET